MEYVLVVPPKLAKSSYEILIKHKCVARPWHLEGRYGSRTHRISETEVGIPVISEEVLIQESQQSNSLRQLLENDQVRIVYKAYHVSTSRCLAPPPPVDARIHPELAPAEATFYPNVEIIQLGSFTYAELFAGIGGFGVALESLGGKCVFCSELDDKARLVYQQNFPSTPKDRIFGDIYQVSNDQLPKQLDLLVGGFPCQPFSAMGNQPGLSCPKGHLFLEIVRVLCLSRPKAFLLENVQGLLKMSDTLAVIVQSLEDCGYKVSMEVCDSRGLTAQSRKRLFIVGMRSPEFALFEFPHVPDLQLRAKDFLEYDLEDENLNVSDLQLQRLVEEKYWKCSHLAWPQVVCRTLVSHYGNSISKGESQLVPCRNRNPRRFSPRECARLMGFPNSFCLPPIIQSQSPKQLLMSHYKQQYRMLGNAVCPPLICAIAGAILEQTNIPNNGIMTWAEFGRLKAVEISTKSLKLDRK